MLKQAEKIVRWLLYIVGAAWLVAGIVGCGVVWLLNVSVPHTLWAGINYSIDIGFAATVVLLFAHNILKRTQGAKRTEAKL